MLVLLPTLWSKRCNKLQLFLMISFFRKIIEVVMKYLILLFLIPTIAFAQSDILKINFVSGDVQTYVVSDLQRIEFLIQTDVFEKSDDKSISVYPNPFTNEISIEFELDKVNDILIQIIDVLGNSVRTIENPELKSGHNTFIWNGKDDNGSELSSGIYYVIVRNDNKIFSKRVMKIK